jgi:hypothetical protein
VQVTFLSLEMKFKILEKTILELEKVSLVTRKLWNTAESDSESQKVHFCIMWVSRQNA